MKKILSFVLVLVLLVIYVPIGTFGVSAAAYSGSLSSTVFWELDTSKGILTIYGTGAIPDQPNLGKPWSSYDKYIKHIVIEKGITQIGQYAFSEMRYFEDIVIPQGVTGIDKRAFQYATAMKTVYIPVSCTWMGFCAFNYCWGLTDVYYEGTASQFNAISKTYAGLGGFDDLFDATKHYSYKYPLTTTQKVQEEANQYVQEHLSFINSNKYNNLTTNASFYNSIWKYEEGSSNFTRYAAWDTIGRVGKFISLDFYGTFKTDNPYDIILTDLFRSYVNEEKSKGVEVFVKEAKKALGAPDVFNSVLSVLKTSEAWDASLERDWNKFTGKVQANWIEGTFLTESTFDLDDYSPELYAFLHEIFSDAEKSQFESVFTGIQNIGTISDYITSGVDVVYSFYDVYQKYLLAQALYDTNEYVLESVQRIATQMSSENSELLQEALAPYWEVYNYDSALDSVFDIMLIDGTLDSIGNVAYSSLGKGLLKDFVYAAIQKITGWNIAALSVTYNLTYMCLDYLSGLGDLTETHRLMNAAALLEKEYIEIAKTQANTLTAEKTYTAAANFDTTWGFLQSLESYCYKTMSAYLSAFKREYTTSYIIDTTITKNPFFAVADGIKLYENLTSCDGAIQAVVYLEGEWINGDCHKGIYSSSNLMTVKCPTDVYVYDSENELVLSIIDNKVTCCAAHITAFVDVDEKIFVLPTDQKYEVRIVATDDGTMDYAVKNFDEIELLRTVTYEDIEISNESNYNAVVLPELYIAKEEYNITTDTGEQIEADFDSMEIENLDFKGASLSLQHNLSINYKVDQTLFEDVGYTNPYVVFELNGVKTKVSTYSVSGDRYVFAFRNIAPNQMNDTIKATLYATYNGVECASAIREYSVAEYCYSMLDLYAADEYAELRTLLVDLLNYGAASQTYTGYRTDSLVNASLTETQLLWGTNEEPTLDTVLDTNYKTVENPTAQWKGAGLNLQESISIRLKFTAENVKDLRVIIESGTGKWTIFSDKFIEEDGVYHVYFIGLDAGQMRQSVYLTIYDGDTPVSNAVCYSIESYAYEKQNSTIAGLPELVKAMMRYGDSAYAYVH
ncbi:MAG: leucine-rich repeat domain-containing protein [Oscillospiraceae bacterium]|nr:leucine-rich repeat domain-containing protein [Oscillospiraceae bacterium]